MAILCDRCGGTGLEMHGYDQWICDACRGIGFISEGPRDEDEDDREDFGDDESDD
jgi:hypothetical protein